MTSGGKGTTRRVVMSTCRLRLSAAAASHSSSRVAQLEIGMDALVVELDQLDRGANGMIEPQFALVLHMPFRREHGRIAFPHIIRAYADNSERLIHGAIQQD